MHVHADSLGNKRMGVQRLYIYMYMCLFPKESLYFVHLFPAGQLAMSIGV